MANLTDLSGRNVPPRIETTQPFIKNDTFAEVTDPTVSVVNRTLDSIYENPGDFRFFGLALGLFVTLLGTTGNGVTVWAYARNRNLQTSFNVLIANLCCVELIFSMVVIPLQLPGYITQSAVYPKEVCATVGYFYYSSMAASLQNLVAIAINRYVGIVDTKRYQKLFTGARLRLCVVSIWLLPPLLYLPVVAGGLIEMHPKSLRCAIGTSGGNRAIRIYNTALNVVYQAGGLILLCVLYTSIIRKVRHVQKKLKMHKKASFNSTIKHSTNTKSEMPKSKNGYISTSGDEALDDFRPSSLVSGGFQFRPARDGKSQEWASDSAPGSDHERASKKYSEHASQMSHATSTEVPTPKPQRRVSIWKALFKNKNQLTVDVNQNRTLSHTGGDTSKDQSLMSLTQEHDSPEKVKEPPSPVVMRNMNQEKKENRRKKSLSAPTLPSMEEIINQSRKNSAAVAKKMPMEVKEDGEGEVADDELHLHRAFTVGSRYKRNMAPKILVYDHENNIEIDLSNRLCRLNDTTLHNSEPMICPDSHSDTPSKTFRGTIARKIREHKRSRRRRRDEREKQREKARRKRLARERQLVYSSFTICIAFAVCILPTAILHVVQVLFQIQIQASIILIVGCISWLHAVTNPFIYGYMNHLYRTEYNRIARELEKKIALCFK